MGTTSNKSRPFGFGVQIVLTHKSGATTVRNYVRTTNNLGQAKFVAWALGDMLLLTDAQEVSWDVHELTEDELTEEYRKSFEGNLNSVDNVQEGRWS